MKLIQLQLTHFKGIERYEVELDGQSISILGANGTGKTTIADAISWLLFDKDTLDRSPAAFGLKTLDEHGQPIHGLEHSVTGVFSVDGKTIMLRKVYSENWTKRRGSSQSELTGHTTDYYWDEEPVSQKEYKERLAEIMPEQLFKMLTLPNYFAEIMHWKERREVLTELCGEITDEEIVGGSEGLSGYLELLDGKTQEARSKILRDRKKKLNDEIDNIPSRIDENNQKIVEPDHSKEGAWEAIALLKENIDGRKKYLAEVQAGGGVADLKVKMQEIEAEKAKARNDHQQEVEEAVSDSRKKVSDLQSRRDEVDEEVRSVKREYAGLHDSYKQGLNAADEVEYKIEKERSRQPEPMPTDDGPKVCPMCDQEIPQKDESEHEAHYEKYLAQFNTTKADTIKKLTAELGELKGKADKALAELEEVEKRGIKVKGRLSQVEQALEKAKADLKEKKESQPEFSSEEFDQKQKALESKIEEIRLSKQGEVDQIKTEITELEEQIEIHQKVIRQHEFNAQLRARNKELQDQLKKYAADLEEVEEGLNLIDDFNRARADFITDRVNDRFSIVKWRLFKEQVNGGIEECCDPVVNGIPYSEGLNNAKRVAAGLDIIATLSQHFGKSAPVCIDNRESVTRLPETGLQIISLVVSPEHPKLTAETNHELQAA